MFLNFRIFFFIFGIKTFPKMILGAGRTQLKTKMHSEVIMVHRKLKNVKDYQPYILVRGHP